MRPDVLLVVALTLGLTANAWSVPSPPSARPTPVEILIHPDGQVDINGAPTGLAALRERLVAVHRADPRFPVLLVAADDVPASDIRTVMKICSEARLTNVSRVKKEPKREGPAVQI